MNIAVVGGGSRCRVLMDSIEKHTFREISPKVVAVADPKDDAPGLVKAREKGLFVTNDYNDFFARDDVDLIIELTGKQDVYEDILLKKKETVRAVNHKTATLFRNLLSLPELSKKQQGNFRKQGRFIMSSSMNSSRKTL